MQRQIYTMTFEEVKEMAARGEDIVSYSGYLLNSRDRKFDPNYAYYIWSGDVDNAIHKGILDPKDNPKGAAAPPNIKPMEIPVNKPLTNMKGKPFTWAFSAINDFDPEQGGCPKYYAHMRYFFDYPFDDKVDHLVWGNYVHKKMENRLKKKIALPEDLQKWEKWCTIIENHAKAVGGTIIVENQYAIDANFKPCSWFDAAAWGRGIVDVAIIAGDKCWVFDWKTGKVSDNLFQLQIFCVFLALHYPDIKTFIPRFIFLKHDAVKPDGNLEIQREELLPVMQTLMEKINRIKEAWKHENFPAIPSGLCGWRPCHKDCAHYRGRQ